MSTPEKYGQEQGVYGQAPVPQGQLQPYAQSPPPMAVNQSYAQPPPMVISPQYHGQIVERTEWQNSLFNCEPISSCLLGWCCPCLLLGQTSSRMRDPKSSSPELVNADCAIYVAIQLLSGCGWIYVLVKRSQIRDEFGIKGGGCGDCCTTYWCHCCALIQQDNEVKRRQQARLNTQGYQAQAGMQMPSMQMPSPQPVYQPQQPQQFQQPQHPQQ
ncbi:PLAC8 family-domain-containing protein [Xylaria cubensis]|nr:PLAC8 family-domain-containing protein [Xylaria cubensis]